MANRPMCRLRWCVRVCGWRSAIASLVCLTVSYSASGQATRTASMSQQVSRLRARIANMGTAAEKIEGERALAYLWLGQGATGSADTSQFVAEAERILREYKHISYHYSYQDVKISCAQFLPANKRDVLLWEVITSDPCEMQPPAGGNHARWVDRLKQGAIWAYLNGASSDAVAAKPDVQRRRFKEEARKLVARLSETEEGRRCIPLAEWWRDVVVADREMNITAPVLVPPPPSKWERVADRAVEVVAEPASRPVGVALNTSTRPVRLEIKRSFDSVEYVGTVVLADPPKGRVPWLPWGLGGLGSVMLTIGVGWVWRTRSRNKSGIGVSP